jgi:hypothetical protein
MHSSQLLTNLVKIVSQLTRGVRDKFVSLCFIVAHQYTPPAAFCEALLRCPPMESNAYFEAIVANGPPRYAGIVRKKYLAEG